MNLFEGKKFLVVEDDEMLREIFSDLFTSQGAHVSEANNGVVAFSLIQANQFDVVFSDVRMPGGDGITLTKNILELTGHKPLVFICSGYNELSAEQARGLQIVKVFDKPFNSSKLVKDIAEMIVYNASQGS
jgi:CheY-like chemotaxis protein